mgnify:CR=1 FL=1
MLKKLNSLLLAAAVISMVACSPTAAPNAPTDGSTTDSTDGSGASADVSVGSITKAQYLTLLECALTRSGASAEAKVGIENIKASVNAIPDAQWNVIAAANPAFSTQLNLAIQSGCSL